MCRGADRGGAVRAGVLTEAVLCGRGCWLKRCYVCGGADRGGTVCAEGAGRGGAVCAGVLTEEVLCVPGC